MVHEPRPIPPPLRTDRRDHLIEPATRQAEIERVDRIAGVGGREHFADVLAQDGVAGDAFEGADADAFAAVEAEFDEGVPDVRAGVEGAGAGGVGVADGAGGGVGVRADLGWVFGVGAVGGPAGGAGGGGEGAVAVDVGGGVELGFAFEGGAVDVCEVRGHDPFVGGGFLGAQGLVFGEVVGGGGGEEAVEAD